MKVFLVVLLLMSASIAQAQVLFHLEGVIASFDEKQVTIEIDGIPFKVPRLSFGKTDLRPGKKVSVGAGLATVLSVNERLTKVRGKPPQPPSVEK